MNKLKFMKKIKNQLLNIDFLFFPNELLSELLSEVFSELLPEILSVEITYGLNKIDFFSNKNNFYSGIFELYTKDNLIIITSWHANINNNIIDICVTNYGEKFNHTEFRFIRFTKLDNDVIIEINYPARALLKRLSDLPPIKY